MPALQLVPSVELFIGLQIHSDALIDRNQTGMPVEVQRGGSGCRNVRYYEIGVAFGFGAVRGLGRSRGVFQEQA